MFRVSKKRDNKNEICIQHVQYAGLDDVPIVKIERPIYALNSYYWIDWYTIEPKISLNHNIN